MLASVVAISCIGLTSCASTVNSESTGQYIDSSATTAKVKSALAQNLGIGSVTAIEVSTYKRVVQLSGFVKSQKEINKAVTVAKSVPGVASVENSLLIKKDS